MIKSASLSLLLLLFSTIVVAEDIPANAHKRLYGQGWECDRGYRRSGNGCVKIQIPEKAHLNYLGSDWECDKGYRRSGSGCVAVQIPQNAHLNYLGNDWECDKGFRRTGNGCVSVKVPQNAHLNYLGNDWECDKGFRRNENRCVEVVIPQNAHLNYLGNDWECDKRFKRVSGKCIPMSAAEIRQQEEQERAVLKKLQERKDRITRGGDCETEYKSGAEVCIQVTNALLDCTKSFDGNSYSECDVDVYYEISTDHRGNGYLDVDVECEVEIEYRRRNFYSNSDSGRKDENHSLYAHGSDSGHMTFDFSFGLFDEVIGAKLDSVKCRIESVDLY